MKECTLLESECLLVEMWLACKFLCLKISDCLQWDFTWEVAQKEVYMLFASAGIPLEPHHRHTSSGHSI